MITKNIKKNEVSTYVYIVFCHGILLTGKILEKGLDVTQLMQLRICLVLSSASDKCSHIKAVQPYKFLLPSAIIMNHTMSNTSSSSCVGFYFHSLNILYFYVVFGDIYKGKYFKQLGEFCLCFQNFWYKSLNAE